MTGPEHYLEAERDIDRANNRSIENGEAAFFLARAQVHATLALTAANTTVLIEAARPEKIPGRPGVLS